MFETNSRQDLTGFRVRIESSQEVATNGFSPDFAFGRRERTLRIYIYICFFVYPTCGPRPWSNTLYIEVRDARDSTNRRDGNGPPFVFLLQADPSPMQRNTNRRWFRSKWLLNRLFHVESGGPALSHQPKQVSEARLVKGNASVVSWNPW